MKRPVDGNKIMWHLKTKTVPIVVGALDVIKTGTQQQINNKKYT